MSDRFMGDNQNLINMARYVSEAIIHLSLNLNILTVNPRTEEIFNCKQANVIGLDFTSVCINAGWSTFSAHYLKQLKAKQIPLPSVEIIRNNEKILWTITYFLDDKEITGFIFIGHYRKKKTYTSIDKSQLFGNSQVIDKFLQEFHQSIITDQIEGAALEYGRNVYKYMENIIAALPGSVYWMNSQGIYLGCNNNMAKLFNLKSRDDIIGKTYEDLYDEKTASFYKRSDEQVMSLDKSLLIEEPLYIGETEKKTYLSNKVPLHDKNGHVIGMLGISVDITAQKEMERLQVENEVHKNSAKEQEKFMKIANQVAHDIRSPLASLLMIVKSCKEIPEEDRIALREASVGISDIANNLLSRYQKKEPDSESQERQPILVSMVLMQIVTEKKYQYQNLPVKFNCDFGSNSYFSFIKVSPSSLKRMLSNLINNAVDAFEGKQGKIYLNVEVSSEWVKIFIQDNGKGMPEAVVDKIMKNIAVTAGKESGHGIGLTQVREALQKNQGEMTIDSKVGKGTKITLTFPRIKTPHWISEEVVLRKEDVIVILDDDTSIHGAWDAHFESILQKTPSLQLKHFTIGSEALSYINDLPEEQKNKIFLLTDYELLKQELNGLHVVAQSGVKRSILVTSHYANQLIQNQAAKTGTKILPKQLASEIPIKIIETGEMQKQEQSLQLVDLVVVDDDEDFVKNLVMFAFSDKKVDEYYDPSHFLNNVSKYDKDTAICLDNNFAKSDIYGLDIAKILHEQGFTRLYILSGEEFDPNQIPNYVTVIRKDDIDRLQEI